MPTLSIAQQPPPHATASTAAATTLATQAAATASVDPRYTALGADEIILWMEAQTSRLHGDIGQMIGTINRQSDVVGALDTLKGQLVSHGPSEGNYGAGADEIDAVLQRYGDKLPSQLRDSLVQTRDQLRRTQDACDAGDPCPTDIALGDDQLQAVADACGSYADGLRNDDQLTMLKIQNLMQKASQVEELASNIVRSLNDAAKSTIENIH